MAACRGNSPVKILSIHNYYQQPGGEDVVFETEAALLRQHGHDVDTLTFQNSSAQSPWEKLKVAYHSFYHAQSAALLAEKIRTCSPDVIHLHNFFSTASPAIIRTAAHAGIPLVMTLHNFRLVCANALLFRNQKPCEDCLSQPIPVSGIRHGCYHDSHLQTAVVSAMTESHRYLRTWQSKVSQYIVLTEFAKQRFLNSRLGLRADQMTVKPNFVFDAGSGDPNRREPYFLYVGRLVEEKGVRILLQAARQEAFPLVMIGEGPLEDLVRETCQQTSHVQYLGRQDKAGVLQALKTAKALLFPSLWYEGFPMTIAEALSCGTPVIASNIGGLPEIVQDERNGLLFQPGDAEDMIDKIRTLQEMESADFTTFCGNARESYLRDYTPETNYRQLLAIYKRALAEKQPEKAKNQ